MDLILYPPVNGKSQVLNECYDLAVQDAVELIIVSAYLTDWNLKNGLNKNCKDLSFIIGTDFGITRKQACKDVLQWLPANMKCEFRAADMLTGFHPKLVAWKNKSGICKLILGSSNLTKAAFSTNYEANIYSEISVQQFKSIIEWIEEIKVNCSVISEDWIDQYQEADRASKVGNKSRSNNNKTPVRVVPLVVPFIGSYKRVILNRRNAQLSFEEISTELKDLIIKCHSTGTKKGNETFYKMLMDCWGNHSSRFQGRGFEILGKHSKWSEVCESLVNIFNHAERNKIPGLDNLVKNEIDRLSELKNPTRGAWLSEMLCHYFPDKYPLVNEPVKDWLTFNKYRTSKNSSEGAKYIDLAIKMRHVITDKKAHGACNLPELDNVIWKWHENQ